MIGDRLASHVSAVVLAAGDGSRMRSSRPKPLHPLCGRPMVLHVIDALAGCPLDRVVVVVGSDAERVTKRLRDGGPDLLIEFVEQRIPDGTAAALGVGMTAFDHSHDLDDEGDVLVVPSDIPLLRAETLMALLDQHRVTGAAVTVLTVEVDDGRRGYGEVVRGRDERIVAVVPHDRVFGDEPAGGEVATGVYCFRHNLVAPALRRVGAVDRIGEDQLSDVVAVLAETGYVVSSHTVTDPEETRGVNDRVDLAHVEHELRRRINLRWLERGVTMVDPEHTYVDTTVELSPDVALFPGTILQGDTVIGERAEIGPETRLVDCVVGSGAVVTSSVGRDAEIGAGAVVGPFAVVQPGAAVAPGATLGPFQIATAEP